MNDLNMKSLFSSREGWMLFFGCGIGILAILFGLVASVETVARLHINAGYYFCLFFFGLLLFLSYRFAIGRKRALLPFLNRYRLDLLFCVVVGLLPQFLQDSQFRVFNDEPAHQMTARTMHEHREVAIPEYGYHLEGTLDFGERSVSYRAYFYPFLVSLVHDLTGFRVGNGLLVNALAGIFLVVAVYFIGIEIGGRFCGFMSVILLASLPLVDLVATAYGSDITSALFVSLAFLFGLRYSRKSQTDDLSLLLTFTSLALLTRNESAILVLFVFFLICLASRSSLKLLHAATAVLVFSLAFVPWFFSFLIFNNIAWGEAYGYSEQLSFFALSNITNNFVLLGAWAFDFSFATPSSPILTLVGVVAFVFFIIHFLKSLFRSSQTTVTERSLLLFIVVLWGGFIFTVMAHFWSPVAGEAVRFLLPFHLGLIFLSAWFFKELKCSARFRRGILSGGVLLLIVYALPGKSANQFNDSASFAKHAEWALSWLKENDDRHTLYPSQLNTFFLLHNYPSLPPHAAYNNIENMLQLVREGFYGRIVVFKIERFSPKTGEWRPAHPVEPVPSFVVASVLAESRFSYNMRARFYSIEGFVDSDGNTVASHDLPLLRDQEYESFKHYFSTMSALHPGFRWNP